MHTNQIESVDREKLVAIAKNAGVSFLALFGSVARGQATAESDVDLARVKLAMERALGRPVDLIPVDNAYPFVREAMMREWIVLYETPPTVSATHEAT